ncbi:hypothetical protein HDE_06382 [Halotydeus destructor]|nr:hypothetical protein HDE_06382 [Halotydeus destructor]
MESVDSLRQLVLENAAKYHFEPEEVEMVRTDHVFLELFTRSTSGTVKEDASRVVKALQFRKKYQLYNVIPRDIPAELFNCRHRLGVDVYGKKVLYVNEAYFRSQPELTPFIINFSYFLTKNYIYGQRCDLYYDLRECDLLCFSDVRLTSKMSSMYDKCFPTIFDMVNIIGCPKLIRPLVMAICSALPEKYSKMYAFISFEEAMARIVSLEACKPPDESRSLAAILKEAGCSDKRIQKIVDGQKVMVDKLEQLQKEMN